MSSILVATVREAVRAEIVLPLAREGLPVSTAADWEGACRGMLAPGTSLLIVDPELPRLQPQLLAALASSVGHKPTVRALGVTLPGIPKVHATERAVLRLARQAVGGVGLDPTERRLLKWQGLGSEPLERLSFVAASGLPTLIHGERGTGKERVARVLHRLTGLEGAFVVLPAGQAWVPTGPPGTLFAESAHRREDLRALVATAREAGWRAIAGTRLSDPLPGIKWDRLLLPPLRERPEDLRGLVGWYLEEHTRRMGLPKRTFDRGLLALLHAHRWPGNHRELEMFVVQALARVDAPVIRGATLPDDLRALLSPQGEAAREAESFEEMARLRLAPVVRAYAKGPGDSLYDLVVQSAERALIQLVLARTHGNRKAAAELLGLARNTLQTRITTLGLGTVGKE